MKFKHHSKLNSESCTTLVKSHWSLANPKHASRWKSLLPNVSPSDVWSLLLLLSRLETQTQLVMSNVCFFKSQCQHVDFVRLLVYKDKQARMQLSMLKAGKANKMLLSAMSRHWRHKGSTAQSDLLFFK